MGTSIINVLILGSTGSIGVNTLDVIRQNSGNYRVWGLCANKSTQAICEQITEFQPVFVALNDGNAASAVEQFVKDKGYKTEVLVGPRSIEKLAEHSDIDVVMAAIVGAAGLASTLAAAKAGKRLLLANKEALVCMGALLMDAVKENGATLLPVDSEHNAIFQCLDQGKHSEVVEKIVLTGSGGPFLNRSKDQLGNITVADACKHPNWSMGQKISVDSATMMNKGLEFIEAMWLFDVSVDQIEILIHPQSIVHSMVQYVDGSTLAQMGCADMRTPIAHALSWPQRIQSGVPRLNLTSTELSFKQPDFALFPCLKHALDSAKAMGAAPIILNAANEIAVATFLAGQIPFLGIPEVVGNALNSLSFSEPSTLEDVINIDQLTRRFAEDDIANFTH